MTPWVQELHQTKVDSKSYQLIFFCWIRKSRVAGATAQVEHDPARAVIDHPFSLGACAQSGRPLAEWGEEGVRAWAAPPRGGAMRWAEERHTHGVFSAPFQRPGEVTEISGRGTWIGIGTMSDWASADLAPWADLLGSSSSRGFGSHEGVGGIGRSLCYRHHPREFASQCLQSGKAAFVWI